MIYCLDNGFVRLVSYMQPVPVALHEFDSLENQHTEEIVGYKRPKEWSADLEIVRNARVSYNADWRATGTGHADDGKDEKLVNYMLSHRPPHSSPFEAMTFTFEVKAPIFVIRQWHRHRTWSYNEVSARYTELPEEFYCPTPSWIGVQSVTNKQQRVFEEGEPNPTQKDAALLIRGICETSFAAYKTLLGQGVPRELARGVLPLNTYTRMFCTVDLWNLLHFITLRDHEHAQVEIRVYAQALKSLIAPLVPHTIKAFDRIQADEYLYQQWLKNDKSLYEEWIKINGG